MSHLCDTCLHYRDKQSYCASRRQVIQRPVNDCDWHREKLIPAKPESDVDFKPAQTAPIIPEEDTPKMKEAKRRRQEKAVVLHKAGEPISQIASHLGVTSLTVERYLKEAEKNGDIKPQAKKAEVKKEAQDKPEVQAPASDIVDRLERLERAVTDIKKLVDVLDSEGKGMAAALLQLLDDLRFHYHPNGGGAVLPSTVPLPRYAVSITDIRDRGKAKDDKQELAG